MKGQLASIIIFFSDMMCSCCLVSTMWCFLRVFSANVLLSLASWTWKKNSEIWSWQHYFVGTNAGFSNYLCVSNIGWGLCDILDNPGQYKSHQPRPMTVTETLVIAHFTKTKSKNCLIINCFEENNLKHTSKWTQFEVAVGNQALHMQPTDKSVVCSQITN